MTDYPLELLTLFMALLGGVLLGILFFVGLWWTVQKALYSNYAGIWFLTSLVLRTSLVIIGIYLITNGQWPRLLACLIGFVAARFLVFRLIPENADSRDVKRGSDEGEKNAP